MSKIELNDVGKILLYRHYSLYKKSKTAMKKHQKIAPRMFYIQNNVKLNERISFRTIERIRLTEAHLEVPLMKFDITNDTYIMLSPLEALFVLNQESKKMSVQDLGNISGLKTENPLTPTTVKEMKENIYRVLNHYFKDTKNKIDDKTINQVSEFFQLVEKIYNLRTSLTK